MISPVFLPLGIIPFFLIWTVKSMIAAGDPKVLLADSKDPRVIQFLTRAGTQGA